MSKLSHQQFILKQNLGC